MVNGERADLYLAQSRKKVFRALLIFMVAVFIGIVSLFVSKFNMSFQEITDFLKSYFNGNWEDVSKYRRMKLIIFDVNLPRAIGALTVGATLSVCGASMQSVLRNPLADPFTLGISSAAALGVALFISMGFTIFAFSARLGLIASAFLFAMIPTIIIVLVSVSKKTSSTMTILIGVAMMYIFSAGTTLIKVTTDYEKLSEIYIWSVGTLNNIEWENIPFLILVAILSTFMLTLFSKDINSLSMGDSDSISLGVNPVIARAKVIIIVSVCTSAAVCFTGTIGFVGLVAPHIARIFVGSDNRILIPCSAAAGGMLLTISETIARMIGPAGLPVGVVTALIGSPIFVYVLIKRRSSVWN